MSADSSELGLLLAASLGTPVGALLACLWRPLRERMPGLLWLAPLPALATGVWALLAPASELGAMDNPALLLDPGRLRLGLGIDRPGAMLIAVAALLWSAAGAYAGTYLRGTPHGLRFAIYWLLTLTGSLGVFLAADLVSFYLLFALVSLPAWGLVIHDGTLRARRAGVVYLALALLGEVFLLLAFVLLAAADPGDSLSIGGTVAALPGSPWRDLTLGLLVAGLGLKAGLVPLHVWLPIAHPAAPMPASAVLSGAIVKAGIVGLVRFLPWDAGLPDWGPVLAALGIFTAFYGVAMGIFQANPKTVLAYSTVSQMGMVCAILGMGLTASGPSAADGAVLAGTLYAVHHLLAKGALFLAVGVAATTGLARLPVVLVPAGVLALGLAGLPLTGGALVKLAAKPVLGDGTLGLLATMAAAGSALLMLHFLTRLAAGAASDARAAAPVGLVWPWWTMLGAALVLPWTLAPLAGLGPWTRALADSLGPEALWGAAWPILTGGLLALGLSRWRDRLPHVPEGDILVFSGVFSGGLARGLASAGRLVQRIDARLGQWPVAALSLLGIALLLWWAMIAAYRT